MTGQHETPARVGPLVDQVRSALLSSSHLLADLEESHPHLRHLLVGGTEDNGGLSPAATVHLSRGPRDILASIQIRQLESAVRYQSDSWFGLWEMIETDLAAGTVNWQPSYTATQRAQKALSSRLAM